MLKCKIMLPVQRWSCLLLLVKPKPVVRVEAVEVNGKIIFNLKDRRQVGEDLLPKDGDV